MWTGVDRVLNRTSAGVAVPGSDEPLPEDQLLPPLDQSRADQPPPLAEQGGPYGPEPTDRNALAQLLQRQASR